jgi:hypothetical protein
MDKTGTKRARRFLMVFGLVFLGLGLWSLDPPQGIEAWAQCVLLILGIVPIFVSWFGSNRWVEKLEQLLTGWP